MYFFLCCALFLQGAFGYYYQLPVWNPNVQNPRTFISSSKLQFPEFDVDTYFNPGNWFSQKNWPFRNVQTEKKLEELYGIIKCLVEEGTQNCKDTLDKSKEVFEKPTKPVEIKPVETKPAEEKLSEEKLAEEKPAVVAEEKFEEKKVDVSE